VRGSAVVVATCLILGAVACGGTKTVARTVTVTGTGKTGVGPPKQMVQFGHVKSLDREGSGYVMRFDPEWFLMGETANKAAAEDGAVPPGEPVPNDNYRVEEGHRLLTYRVPADARVRVLTTSSNLEGTPITVAQLAQIVAGKNPVPLFEPIATGFWIRIDIDTVRSIEQQYIP
jgi:hypothetical protein